MRRPDSLPPGFQRYSRDGFDSDSILLPTRLKMELIAEDKRRLKEKEEQRAEIMAAEITQSQQDDYLARRKFQDDPENDACLWRQIDDTDKMLRSHTRYPIFKSEQALTLLKGLGRGESDDKQRLEKIYKELTQRGTTLRKIARPRSLKVLEQLADKQPHMRAVVFFVIAQIRLAQRSRKPVRLQPMLLLGEPGVGKTHFAYALADALSTTIHIEQMDSDLAASFLLGLDRKWANSQHGMLFDKVVLGEHANPVIVLDELDKCQRSLSHGSPQSCLYSVL